MERRISRDGAHYAAVRPHGILGKQKALELKKNRSWLDWIRFGLRFASVFLLLVFFLIAALTIRSYLLYNPKFRISIKEIYGLRQVSEGQILAKLKDVEGRSKNLFGLDLDALRRSVELLPWVKAATIQRILPDKLIIQIIERTPIAFARMERSTILVDDDGMLLETKGQGLSGFDFPIISGLESGFDSDVLARNKKRVRLYEELMSQLDAGGAGLSRDISEIHLQDPGSVSVLLNEDSVLVHLGGERFQERFRRYLAMSHEIKQKYSLVDSVDLRFENQVVINTATASISSSPVN